MRFGYWILSAIVVSLFASCTRDSALHTDVDGDETLSDLVMEVSASVSDFSVGLSRAEGAEGTDDDVTTGGDAKPVSKMIKDNKPEEEGYILGKKGFEKGDKLYILQRAPSLTPKFPGDYFDHRNDTDEQYEAYRTQNKLDNIYVYEYDPNHGDASWGAGYNFKVKEKWSDPIKWSTVKERGSIGNSFVFFAFCDNLKDLEPESDDPLLRYWKDYKQYVEKFGPTTYYHHAYGGQWKKSDKVHETLTSYDYSNDWHIYHYENDCGVPDFLGAYHTVSTLYSRPRFRLYHLLAYVRVTLYVPVVQEYEETDPVTKETATRITGYDETAFVLANDGTGQLNGGSGETADYRAGVSIGNHNNANRVLLTRFTIDWAANRSSDWNAPLTQTLTPISSLTPGFIFYYSMYCHNPLDITDPCYKPKTAQEDYDAIKEGIGVEELDVTEFVAQGADKTYLTQKKDEKGNPVYTADGKPVYIDSVRRYEFSASMPAQNIPTSGSYYGKAATKTLVDIHVRTPGATNMEEVYNGTQNNSHNNFAEYTLTSDNFFNDKEGENNEKAFTLKQGTITHLHIYLPRVADRAILVKADVQKWEETSAEMAVTPEEW